MIKNKLNFTSSTKCVLQNSTSVFSVKLILMHFLLPRLIYHQLSIKYGSLDLLPLFCFAVIRIFILEDQISVRVT